ncbi:hypothetical protein H6G89_22105 [Oscillatoria sp. FACHB-1407]|uniref:hypothetical protein n=1 Tax=Oscillatoria sp. FACHB-1407 TaxID=2692847 RepID=UPI001686E3F1|nr:hypothetical protein [Oscillatoria sp. FACHB-1407]MBD2463698.1 hypothetical protein [Oscillatoria sp. FACHB-1407]
MRSRSEWQGYSGYWQNCFIHHHLLTIGYAAWDGYTTQGRGMVVCQVLDKITSGVDWRVDPVSFEQNFISQAQVAQYMTVLELEQDAVTALLNAIATYDPTQAIVLLVTGNGSVHLNLLQNLAISPTDCYRQVQHRWAEFQPDLTIPRRQA